MGKLLKQYWLNNRKAISSMLLVTFLLVGGFLAYLKLIGIPRTEARTLYNEAQLLLFDDRDDEAKALLEKAYSIWPEEYIQTSIANID